MGKVPLILLASLWMTARSRGETMLGAMSFLWSSPPDPNKVE